MIVIKTRSKTWEFIPKDLISISSFFEQMLKLTKLQVFDLSFFSDDVGEYLHGFINNKPSDYKNPEEILIFVKMIGCSKLQKEIENHLKFGPLIAEFEKTKQITQQIEDIKGFKEYISNRREIFEYVHHLYLVKCFAKLLLIVDLGFENDCFSNFDKEHADCLLEANEKYFMKHNLSFEDKLVSFLSMYDHEKAINNPERFTKLFYEEDFKTIEDEFKRPKYSKHKKEKLSKKDKEVTSDDEVDGVLKGVD
jgi:hypothetical protein